MDEMRVGKHAAILAWEDSALWFNLESLACWNGFH